jgi:hypothetical protein
VVVPPYTTTSSSCRREGEGQTTLRHQLTAAAGPNHQARSLCWPLGLDATPTSIIFDEQMVCDKLSMVPRCFGPIRNSHEIQLPGACLLCARIPRGGTQEIIRCLYAPAICAAVEAPRIKLKWHGDKGQPFRWLRHLRFCV